MSEKEYELKLQITRAEAEKIQKEIIFENQFNKCQQEDIYFYPKGENVFKYMNRKCLRIRTTNGKSSLDFKELFDESNIYMQKMVEYSTDVSNIEQMEKILNEVGLCRAITINKERWQCIYNKQCKLCLDYVKELGFFLEIELLNTEETDEILDKRIQDVLKDLYISEIVINKIGYSNMLLKKLYGDKFETKR